MIEKRGTQLIQAAIGTFSADGSQNFLGAPWVERLVTCAPRRFRTDCALFLVSLSPHYCRSIRERKAEADRNRVSREDLVREVLLPYLRPEARVLDYGCGPGYMAAAVSPFVSQVEAVDVSRGVLACAKWVTGAEATLPQPVDAIDRVWAPMLPLTICA